MSDAESLDKLNLDRIEVIWKKVEDGNVDALDDIFQSERVNNQIEEKKILLNSFDMDQILINIPFSNNIYARICPMCINEDNILQYKTLIERGALIPVLIAPYRLYENPVVIVTEVHDHINVYEYQIYRDLMVRANSNGGICPHCVGKREKKIFSLLKKNPEIPINKEGIERAVRNLVPYVAPDFSLIDDLSDALSKKNYLVAQQIIELTSTVSDIRSAQAFEAPMLINADEMEKVPRGISDSIDTAIYSAKRAKRQISEGLGLSIPFDLPLESYIEIASDFRPKIEDITSKISLGDDNRTLEQAQLSKQIIDLNSEIERVKNSNRYIILEAGVEFYQKNNIILNAALSAAAVGLIQRVGWEGCVAGATSAVATGARKMGALKGGPAVERLGRRIQNEIQPAIDNLVAKYVGASDVAIRVLSMKKRLNTPKKQPRIKAMPKN
jgi:hypothetical protein